MKNSRFSNLVKTIRHLFCASWIVLLLFAASSGAQTYSVLHNFTGDDGWEPDGALVVFGTSFYGTCNCGGIAWTPAYPSGYGVVYRIRTDGSSFTVLKRFAGGLDGANSDAGLVLGGTTLYGVTQNGGANNLGTLFKLNADGTAFTVLKSFAQNSDGYYPNSRPVLADGTLYGTTHASSDAYGLVFKVNTDGSGYTVLKSFYWTNGDGTYPDGGLVLSGTTLYGVNSSGGINERGTLFELNIDGSGFNVINQFTVPEGFNPNSALVLADGVLYGTTCYGGTSNRGTVFSFSFNKPGGLSVLKHFTGTDGANPWKGGLVLAGETLFGTTGNGGAFGLGTVFKVNTNGSGFAVLKSFTGSDGANPRAGLVLSGSTLYGTTGSGGVSNRGVVFSLTLPVPPTILSPPATQTAEAGTPLSLSVQVSGAPPFAYQWQLNGNALNRATNSALPLPSVQVSNVGAYTVVVTNAFGVATSAPALLNVIVPVQRRPVSGLTLTGQPGTLLNLDFTAALGSSPLWTTFDHVPLTTTSQWYFDVSLPLPPQGFYRAWQSSPGAPPALNLHFVPALTLTGAIGSSLRLDYINQFGPTDAWVTNLATVTLTNNSQLYFDTSAIGQPPRLWRIVPLP